MAECHVKHVLAPPTDLEQLAALLQCSDLHIGNDSGPRHIAVACRTPTLTVFLESDPSTWTFPDAQHRVVMPAIAAGEKPNADDTRCKMLEQLMTQARELIGSARPRRS